MATSQAGGVSAMRYCCVCNIHIMQLKKSYRSLIPRTWLKGDKFTDDINTKTALVKQISAAVGGPIDPSGRFSVVCEICLRRIQSIEKWNKSIREESERLRTDYQRTRPKDNNAENVPPTPSTPPKAVRKRQQQQTPTKAFSPSSKVPGKKRGLFARIDVASPTPSTASSAKVTGDCLFVSISFTLFSVISSDPMINSHSFAMISTV